VYTEGRDDDGEDEREGRLPALAEGDATHVADVTPTQHFTEPPPRYTEATLIKALEENGIGRPSTYAATISTICPSLQCRFSFANDSSVTEFG